MAASSFRFVWTHIAAGSFSVGVDALLLTGRFGSSGSCRGLILGQRGVMGWGVLRDPVFEARKEFSWLSNR